MTQGHKGLPAVSLLGKFNSDCFPQLVSLPKVTLSGLCAMPGFASWPPRLWTQSCLVLPPRC